MDDQKLPMLANQLPDGLPEKWQKKYLLKRIGEEDIAISFTTRNEIIKQMANGGRFVQVGEYTVMLNAIKGIDPQWGAKNIPPRPTPVYEFAGATSSYPIGEAEIPSNQDEISEWDRYFGTKKYDDTR